MQGYEAGVKVILKEYLLRLKAGELDRPPAERRAVPTMKEFADSLGVTRQVMYVFVNNARRGLNTEILDGVINELRRRGFDPQIDDLLAIREGEPEPASLELAAVRA